MWPPSRCHPNNNIPVSVHCWIPPTCDTWRQDSTQKYSHVQKCPALGQRTEATYRKPTTLSFDSLVSGWYSSKKVQKVPGLTSSPLALLCEVLILAFPAWPARIPSPSPSPVPTCELLVELASLHGCGGLWLVFTNRDLLSTLILNSQL